MRATKQPEAETLEVMDVDKEIRLLLRDLKFAALDALLLRIRHGEISTDKFPFVTIKFEIHRGVIIRNFRPVSQSPELATRIQI